jgi:hypothetical protein
MSPVRQAAPVHIRARCAASGASPPSGSQRRGGHLLAGWPGASGAGPTGRATDPGARARESGCARPRAEYGAGLSVGRGSSFLLALSLCLCSLRAVAEPPPAPADGAEDHAPRVFALSGAGSYTFRNKLPLSESGESVRPWGLQAGARFGWQVGGLAGGRASWVGFEMVFAAQPGHDYRSSYALLYGIFAKHALTRHTRLRPYFAYGLGAGQVWVHGVDGRGTGHQTRVEIGLDVRRAERRQLTLSLIYQALIMPGFARDGAPPTDTSSHALVLATGVWFGR